MEMADKNASELNAEASKTVNALQKPAGESKEEAATPKTSKQRAGEKGCYRCGGLHSPNSCCFKTERCRRCGKTGHIGRKCKAKQIFQGEVEEQEQETYGLYGIKTVTKSRSSAYMITVKVNGHMLEMIVDTGAVVSVVPEWMYQKYLAHLPLVKARDLRSYSGDRLELLGESTVTVEYGTQKCELPLVIVKGDKPALFGRNWLEKIKLDWGRFL